MRRRDEAARGGTKVLASLLTVLLLAALSVAQAPPALADPPQAVIDDAELGWGESTTVHGIGWQPGARISVILYAGGETLATPVAEADGSITATITIPEGKGTSPDYQLAVQGGAADGSYGYVLVPLSITGPTASVAVADHELGWGDTTTVSGTRFQPGGAIKVTLLPGNEVLGETTAGDDEGFSVDITIPTGLRSSKGYQIVVTGRGVDSLPYYLPTEVTIVGPRPTTSVSPTRVAWEQAVNVHGDLFKAGTVVELHVLPNTIKLGEATVRDDGTFDATVRIPTNLPTSEEYWLLATGTGADSLFAYLPVPITIIGDRPFIDVSTNRPGRGGAVTVAAHKMLPGTVAQVTLVPGFERLDEVTVGEDGTFTTTVRIPADAAFKDPHSLVVTGYGRDGLFAYLQAEMLLGGDPPAGSGGATGVPPDIGDLQEGLGGGGPQPDPVGVGDGGTLPTEKGPATNALVAVVLALLAGLIVLLLLLSTRRDLREAAARRWAAVVHRIPGF